MQALLLITALAVSHPPIPKYVERPDTPQWANTAGEIANIDPLFISAVAWAESRHNAKALGDYRCKTLAEDGESCLEKGSPASFGLFQIQLASCKSYFRYCKKVDLFNPSVASVIVGMLWRRMIYRSGRKKAAVVYNCGPVRCGRGKRMMKHTPATKSYFKNYERLVREYTNNQVPSALRRP